MSMAIAYAMKKKAQKMAEGGEDGPCDEHGTHMCEMCHGGMYAKGGHVKGVHESLEGGMYGHGSKAKGQSEAGSWVRLGEKARRSGISPGSDYSQDKAKDLHRQKLEELKSMDKPELYAEGGAVEEDDRMLNQHGEEEVGAMDMEEDNGPQHERMIEHPVENQDDHEDMVGRIMRQRTKHFSEGGRVANDTPVYADFEDNQFDDLVKDDDLDQHDTGKNSGDELGDAQEDEDRRDIVSRIMKSRRMKDRMPRPA